MNQQPADPRAYPDRPILAVSAAIIRDGNVLIVQRARPPARGIYTLPGGVVEAGETLTEALLREIQEETGLTVEPVAMAGHREVVVRDEQNRVARHFVILCFASLWLAGEPVLNEELSAAHWLQPSAITGLNTTEGLDTIVATAFTKIDALQ